MNCVADVRDDRCIIWAPTQAPNSLQEEVAKFLGTGAGKSRSERDLDGRRIRAAARGRLRFGSGGNFSRRSRRRCRCSGLGRTTCVTATSRPRPFIAFPPAWIRRTRLWPGDIPRRVRRTISNLPDPAAVRDAGFYQDLSWGVYDMPYTYSLGRNGLTWRLICRCDTVRGARFSRPRVSSRAKRSSMKWRSARRRSAGVSPRAAQRDRTR